MKTLDGTAMFSDSDITEHEHNLVSQVLRGELPGATSMIDRFEAAVADFVGAQYAVAVSSGTAGLHLAALAAELGPDDAVITTPFSSIASVNCALYVGAIPVFVDIDPDTLNLDPALVAQAADDLAVGGDAARRWLPPPMRDSQSKIPNLKSVLPVHIFGHPCAMDSLMIIAREHGLVVIEDAREALGSQFRNRSVGTFGACGVFSFSSGKQITTGEGGMLVTEDKEWALLFRSLRDHGRSDVSLDPPPTEAEGDSMGFDTQRRQVRLGYDYQLKELSAALGVGLMERIDETLDRREQVAGWYAEQLANVDGVRVPQVISEVTRMSWPSYVVRLSPELDRDRIAKSLAERGIPTSSDHIPLHLQPVCQERFGFREGDFPVTERVARSTLVLPISSQMSQEQVEQICQTVKDSL